MMRGFINLRGGRQILSIRVDHNFIARYLFGLLKSAGAASPVVVLERSPRLGLNRYVVMVDDEEQAEALLVYFHLKDLGMPYNMQRPKSTPPRRRCCLMAFIRGSFLAAGSISVSSRSGYHLEICSSLPDDLEFLKKCMSTFGLEPLHREYKENSSLYFKRADSIADFLRVIGANSALLHLESVRVVKSMRNRVNRLVNCDTANLDKVVVSAQQQLKQIGIIERIIGLKNLPPSLKEAAQLRRRYPESSLKELGEKLDPPVGKSGMNHRFRQLEKIARKSEGG